MADVSGPEVSHGRGGRGNIAPDNTPYADGEVTRVGPEGSHGDGAFSTGRGGLGNVGDAGTASTARLDKDQVPEEAVRPSSENTDHHTGRGGAGNAHIAEAPEKGPEPSSDAPISLADKLKSKIFGRFSHKK